MKWVWKKVFFLHQKFYFWKKNLLCNGLILKNYIYVITSIWKNLFEINNNTTTINYYYFYQFLENFVREIIFTKFFYSFYLLKTRPQLYYVAPWCLLHITMLYITTIILCSTVFCIFPFEKMYVAKKISFIFLKLHIQKKK